MKESTSMTMFDRLSIKVVAAGAGLCGVAIALSPDVAAAQWVTGGYDCIQTSAGEVVGAAPAAAACAPAGAALTDMAAGIPMALPGPIPVAPPVPVVPVAPPIPVVPVAPPVPVVPVVPAGAPVGVPVAAGAPLLDMAGGYGGKGDPIEPAPAGAPAPGQPILPGPAA
jgi:hypothetical protein